jgi:cell wall-associated NlpC family hydrolase
MIRAVSRLAALVAGTLVLAAAAAAQGGPPQAGAAPAGPSPAGAGRSWAAAQIRTVTDAGLLGGDRAAFRADDVLTRGELYEALTALGKPAPAPVDPGRGVTVRELHARLVAGLGLLPLARRIRVGLRDAGLQPTAHVGTEAVARMLRLRFNHPQSADERELRPHDPATRAEAAYSLSRLLALQEWELQRVRDAAGAFVVPALGDWQRQVLSRALRFVGFPYVFAGSSERPQQVWTTGKPVPAPAGFDCSGFVWRVYKLEPFAGAPTLGGHLRGRTTYAMSAEVKRTARIGREALQPGDLIFFGPRGPRSRPAEIGHMGIYLGHGWFVHSSSEGVALELLAGFYETRFAWARRPLAEAGLSA